MAATIGDITLGTGINDIAVSGFSAIQSYPFNSATMIAHPSNSGILYIRRRTGTSGFGFPLNAGVSLTLGAGNLYDYTASGVSGQRLAWVVDK